MNKTSQDLPDKLERSHLENDGKKRLTQMVALVAFGASVGLTAEVNAAPPSDLKKVSKQVDAKDLKVKRTVDAKEVKNVETRKLEVKKVGRANTQFDPDSGPIKPPPP